MSNRYAFVSASVAGEWPLWPVAAQEAAAKAYTDTQPISVLYAIVSPATESHNSASLSEGIAMCHNTLKSLTCGKHKHKQTVKLSTDAKLARQRNLARAIQNADQHLPTAANEQNDTFAYHLTTRQ